ncbi:uncharacterized protein DUF3886 [Aneurinibacillus soli]|uniref:Uncharacterized protein n=1 Tax=Aneurinibacillus soli TaxID=1500254 RepID=A0A0U5BCG3_9BACL|nr:YqkE family protein [Aneurinibacillus soli]PYE62192.1 uncharacterized protein DUF3886 [Aneurinibacillus soli]BAU28620.1 hypothetical protein CB4_02795 [Aneurinibacillus soli]
MAKQKRTGGQVPKPAEEGSTLKDLLGEGTLDKLKNMSRTMKEEEEKKRVAALEQQRAEQKEREKNKSFSELLDESHLDWKKFK